MQKKLAYKIPEAARALGLDVKIVREAIQSGQIPSIEIGTRRLVPMYWIREQENGPVPQVSAQE